MTENEAIERIRSGICNEIGTQRFCRDSCMYGIDKCAYSMAIQALEKQIPYKPQEYEDKYYGCKCGEVLLEKWEEYPKKLMPKSWGLPYCLGCGQKPDWQ